MKVLVKNVGILSTKEVNRIAKNLTGICWKLTLVIERNYMISMMIYKT